MEGLGDERRVDRGVGERDRLGRPGERLGRRNDALQHGTHARERLDGDHAWETVDEETRELPGAGGEVEHDDALNPLDHLRGPGRAAELVVLGDGVEAQALRVAHAGTRWRARTSASCSGSRRWAVAPPRPVVVSAASSALTIASSVASIAA